MNRIYLIGFMGAGKSTLGRELAASMGYAFLDMDELICRQAGRPVSDIFAENGESFFRILEREILHQTILAHHTIIACGGGTPCYADNMDWMKRRGVVIWLQEEASVLAYRLSNEQAGRPLLKHDENSTLEDHIRILLSQRESIYARAHFTLSNASPDKALRLLKGNG